MAPNAAPINSSYLHQLTSNNATSVLLLVGDPRYFPANCWQCLTLDVFKEHEYCNASTLDHFFGSVVDEWKPFGRPVRHC